MSVTFYRRLPPVRSRFRSGLITVLVLAAGALGLAATNPGQARFEDYAGDQLSDLISREICQQGGLSGLLQLLLPDCTALVQAQRPVFGRLAWAQTRRQNFGLFSLYRTEMGGQQLMPQLRLPVYRATTLGVAGQLLLLSSDDKGGTAAAR